MPKSIKTYYVHDPMCAWCWGFEAVKQKIFSKLTIPVEYLVGGLSPDTTELMPISTQKKLQLIWQQVHKVTGVEFNFNFWSENTAIRSTYPACRAVLAAGQQQSEKNMIRAIQQSYYLKAKNPSLSDTLIRCAEEIQLDVEQFKQDLISASINDMLCKQISFARSIGGNSFPSLILEVDKSYTNITINYTNDSLMFRQISDQIEC